MRKSVGLNFVKIFIFLVVFFCADVFAKTYSFPCPPCGNSSAPRINQTALFLAQYVDGSGNNLVQRGDGIRVLGGDGTKAIYKKLSQYTSGYRWGCIANCTQFDNDDSLFYPPTMGNRGGGYWGIGNSYDFSLSLGSYVPQYDMFHVVVSQGGVFIGEYDERILVGYIYTGSIAPRNPFGGNEQL
jgi:hypothetical protein